MYQMLLSLYPDESVIEFLHDPRVLRRLVRMHLGEAGSKIDYDEAHILDLQDLKNLRQVLDILIPRLEGSDA